MSGSSAFLFCLLHCFVGVNDFPSWKVWPACSTHGSSAFDGVSVSTALVQHGAFFCFGGLDSEGSQSRMTDASGLEGRTPPAHWTISRWKCSSGK